VNNVTKRIVFLITASVWYLINWPPTHMLAFRILQFGQIQIRAYLTFRRNNESFNFLVTVTLACFKSALTQLVS